MSSGQPTPTKLPANYSQVPYQEIRISHHPASSAEVTPVLVCTLYRPQARNAFTDIMTDELVDFFGLASIDDRVKAIVFTGYGNIFCAGLDLQQGFRLQSGGKAETEKTHRDGGGRISLAIHQCTKPTIAAINGHAVGVGITMTLACVSRIVYSKAKIGFVFARRGLVTEACSSFFLPRLIGHSRTLHLATTGAVLPATDKLFDGLFSETIDTQVDVLPRALAVAEDIAKNTSTVSTYMIREMLYRGPQSAEEAHLLESRVMGAMRGSKDNDEAVDAFLKKRDAKFTSTVANDSPPVHPWFSPVNTKNNAVAYASTTSTSKL